MSWCALRRFRSARGRELARLAVLLRCTPSRVCMWLGACLVVAPSWAAGEASSFQARHESKLALPIAGVDHLVRAPAPERPLKTWRYADVDGEHLLVVHKTPLPQEGTARGQAKVEHHALKVTDFLEKKGEQVVNWQIKESVDCPGAGLRSGVLS